ncbi:TPA: hypothetical protein QCN45_005313 [Bacillus cereus]|nr:hypothetical protein [Bacillus cereus]
MIFAIDARLCHSFHEIELLDIPNILFPSQRGKLYQVIGIGMQEEYSLVQASIFYAQQRLQVS